MATSGCGPMEFMDGGTLNNVHIFNSEFTNGFISNSELSNISLTNNISIDENVAQRLAEQMCSHIKSCVSTITTDVPDATAGGEIPTTIIGRTRSEILGAPVAWIDLGDYLIPAYAKPSVTP